MSSEESPDDDLSFVRECISAGQVVWTYHVNMRLGQRNISRGMVFESSGSFEVLERNESSESSRYLPSVLVFAEHEGRAFHILFAIDRMGDHVRIVTAYFPDAERWESGLKRRRQP